jgi:hypothetical protein
MLLGFRTLFSVRRLRYLRNGVLTTVPMPQQSRYSDLIEANDAGRPAAGNNSSIANRRESPFNRARDAYRICDGACQRTGSTVTTSAPGTVSRRVGTNWVPA